MNNTIHFCNKKKTISINCVIDKIKNADNYSEYRFIVINIHVAQNKFLKKCKSVVI